MSAPAVGSIGARASSPARAMERAVFIGRVVLTFSFMLKISSDSGSLPAAIAISVPLPLGPLTWSTSFVAPPMNEI